MLLQRKIQVNITMFKNCTMQSESKASAKEVRFQ